MTNQLNPYLHNDVIVDDYRIDQPNYDVTLLGNALYRDVTTIINDLFLEGKPRSILSGYEGVGERSVEKPGGALENPSSESLEAISMEVFRYWLNGVFTNVLVLFGLIANILTLTVLCQRQMISSTNSYLSALAVWDCIVLIMTALLIGLPAIIPPFREMVQAYVISYLYPLALVAQTATIWLTVSFTVERYIAVSYPLKAASMCTVSRARMVVGLVSVSSALYNLPRWFEYRPQVTTTTAQVYDADTGSNKEVLITRVSVNTTSLEENATYRLIHRLRQKYLIHSMSLLVTTTTAQVYDADTGSNKEVLITRVSVNTTSLEGNATYRLIYYSWLYLPMMCIIPLGILFALNLYLILAVRRSRRSQTEMNVKQSRENNVTIMLSGVVIVFIVCQVPALVYNVVHALCSQETLHTSVHIIRLSEIRNFLVNINSACNFLLYCAFGQKFRRVFLKTFCPRACVEPQHPHRGITAESRTGSIRLTPMSETTAAKGNLRMGRVNNASIVYDWRNTSKRSDTSGAKHLLDPSRCGYEDDRFKNSNKNGISLLAGRGPIGVEPGSSYSSSSSSFGNKAAARHELLPDTGLLIYKSNGMR